MREEIFDAIGAERDRQDRQWGGPVHDDTHTSQEWGSYRGKFENRQQRLDGEPARQYDELVKLAALCVAQMESLQRKGS